MSDARAQDHPNSIEKKHRVRLIAAVNGSCTGCEVCVDFCPVDCIDDVFPDESPRAEMPRIQIRVEECIGCQICAKVCDELTWNAIEMVSVDEFERRFGLHISDHIGAEASPPPAPATAP